MLINTFQPVEYWAFKITEESCLANSSEMYTDWIYQGIDVNMFQVEDKLG